MKKVFALVKLRDLIRKNNIHVFSSNYTIYGDLSHRAMRGRPRLHWNCFHENTRLHH